MSTWDIARAVVAAGCALLAFRQFGIGFRAACECDEVFGDEYRALRRTYWRSGGYLVLWAGAAGLVGFNPAIGAGFALMMGPLLVANAFQMTDFLQPVEIHEAKRPKDD
ncbi:SdpI/YhfL protein family OS=Tsukamurella paurometabola (strain ATCC 8368 / DSM / CCUG 35730/ CIP 100753 / JCM 10117 / KCTC 9821 / NBRC 16120 / NCIMB 702349/ NCTC 13040) OX=521096 GN=Tpau_0014 PE=4 SV=1 [Tsukamurella paurometabola]|uniref:Uncharacterized protein n=1 Tax=Tsukamurella paurometabola (strain ATCC 8368 / DSM 20162 / CCUG 35730 / CIP 100753 / JCM 10117 / KCTC 9821 / NBRC 16120 / NCIMB 702349 / NCTC 13040) TaxID=521096 RepID=D5UPB6_TSUPD|nr:hypothetical protein [Tsukamurella paurometabola]ADG76668.1 hypothetical protein Tpau_0014 [Tsukamurella paurometabola DSM 20162]SUP41141.1 Uncharacterised protein [Tsukamurella paurometabola]